MSLTNIFAMGASESKLVFKQGIFRLSEEKDIPAGDPYWARVCLPRFISPYKLLLIMLTAA